jgi:hypothetical protein
MDMRQATCYSSWKSGIKMKLITEIDKATRVVSKLVSQ